MGNPFDDVQRRKEAQRAEGERAAKLQREREQKLRETLMSYDGMVRRVMKQLQAAVLPLGSVSGGYYQAEKTARWTLSLSCTTGWHRDLGRQTSTTVYVTVELIVEDDSPVRFECSRPYPWRGSHQTLGLGESELIDTLKRFSW